ncbi:hypothetical protein E3N88_11546 [Mikania micrantha]|uniref:chloroplast protein-transporting ATPase n=1 Tax=Mikania micrantha TaxID=192012 RepID=A0A5N6PDT1_9ASTR|nr:hypothetical protein E3N88_11546 [Mikania micrantha]
MALASLSHGNTFSSSSSSIFSSKSPNLHHLFNPNCTPNLLSLKECTSSSSFGFHGGNKHKFYHSDSNRVRSDRKTTIVPAASLGGLLGGIFKSGADTGESTRQQYSATVALINSLESELSSVSDSVLRERTDQLKQRARQSPQSLDSLLPEAFAIVREASKRVLGLRPFDVQLIGGMVLHKGEIAEMRTGEGKTLVAILPAYLNALSGKGVHIVTVNDYLARRDCEWVGQVARFLGLTVGLIQQNMTSEERRQNYLCDITYSVDELVIRGFNYCVIDEVDEKQKNVLLTEQGYADAEEILEVKDLYDPREQWASFIINAIKAKELFLRDVNYIIRGKEVLIVDEFSGRVMQGRRWSDGLHQAVEAKERLPIQNETVTLASIKTYEFDLWNFTVPKLCGMTGTAATESSEFESIYKLKVTIVPTNKPMIRKDESDVVFRATTGKWQAVVVEISRMNKTGRPVLVGTTSVEQSDLLSTQLREVLNAKPENVEREAEIVAQSGRLGAHLNHINAGSIVKLTEGVFCFCEEGPSKEDVEETTKVVEDAVQLAASSWGRRSLPELEAEERLSYACEKVTPVE